MVSQVCHGKNNKNNIFEINYRARISLLQQMSMSENEKYEVEDKLPSYTEGLIKTKENGHNNNTVRARLCHDWFGH